MNELEGKGQATVKRQKAAEEAALVVKSKFNSLLQQSAAENVQKLTG